jgi:hypothetical protein
MSVRIVVGTKSDTTSTTNMYNTDRFHVQVEQRVKKQKLKHRVHLQAVRKPKSQPGQPNHDGPTVQHKDPRFSPTFGFFARIAIATLHGGT